MSTLLTSAARTSSGTLALAENYGLALSGQFLLNVTAAATAAGDTLDVYLQHSIDEGTTHDDFIHFTQVLGDGGAVKHLASWIRDVVPEDESRTPLDGALGVGVLQGPVGGLWRIKWVVVSASAPSFTFAIESAINQR